MRSNKKSSLLLTATAVMLGVGPALADDKAEIAELKARLNRLEAHQVAADKKQKRTETELRQARAAPLHSDVAVATVVRKDSDNPLTAAVNGKPIRVLTDGNGSEVDFYGIIEPTFLYQSRGDKNGQSKVGLNTSWFSGNRFGFFFRSPTDPTTGLHFIGRLESEFENPTGNFDTNGVIFNRDAWAGVESEPVGKITFGRQNTLPRDVSNIYGDPYGAAQLRLDEGGWTNVNNFKQLIFYSGGGYGAHGAGDTRMDNSIVWKKIFSNGLYLGAAYAFSDGNGPGGPNGSGSLAGAGFNKGSVQSIATGYNGDRFHVSAFYNHTDVLQYFNGSPLSNNAGHTGQSIGIGGNYEFGLIRLNAGYFHYTQEQGFVGTRTDNAVTTSVKITPPGKFDYEIGWQDMFVRNAGLDSSGYTYNAYQDASSAVKSGSGTRMTTYGSIIYHPIKNVDVYVAADYLLTSGQYFAAQALGSKQATELASGFRYKF